MCGSPAQAGTFKITYMRINQADVFIQPSVLTERSGLPGKSKSGHRTMTFPVNRFSPEMISTR
jgi:hypothetical protein